MTGAPNAGNGTRPAQRRRSRLVLACGVTGIAIGASALIGWWVGLPRLTNLLPGNPPMVANAALMAVLTGLALLLHARPPASRTVAWAARTCAGATVLVAGATLVEYAFRVDLGIDLLLAPRQAVLVAPYEGRPTPGTALSFLLLGAALLVIDRSVRRRIRPAELLALGGGAIPLVGLLGYVLGVRALYDPETILPHAGMGLHVAVMLITLSVGVVATRPESGLVSIVTSPGMGGVAARRLLVGLLLYVPVALAVMLGAHAGWYELPVAVAVVVFLALVEAAAAILHTSLRIEVLGRRVQDALARARRAQRQTAVQRRWLEAAVDQMPEGVVILDGDGRVSLSNRAATELLGVRVDEGMTLRALAAEVRDPSGEAVPLEKGPLARAFTLGERITSAEYLVVRGDETIPVLVNATPIHLGHRLAGAVSVFQDIRPLKALERLREEWTAIVAHDLRHPVSTIVMATELLHEELRGDGLTPTTAGAVEKIRTATARLERMIDDLLDATRIEADRLSVTTAPGEVLGLARRTAEGLGRVTAGRSVRVSGEPVWAEMDADRVRQVLENLVSNAVKYGWPDTDVEVRTGAEPGQVRVTVSNRGPGIPPEELPKLFRRFRRTEPDRPGRPKGIGLGLYIARGIVEAHGGRIWVESTPGEITRFHFTLPAAAPPERPAPPPP